MISKIEKRKPEEISTFQNIQVKNVKSRESLNQEIRKEVDDNSPDKKTFEIIEKELTQLESEIKSEFPLSEVVCIGSLEYRLYLKDSPVDLLVQSNECLEESENFESRLEAFLRTLGDIKRPGNYFQLVRSATVNIYCGSRLPRVTCMLMTRYVSQSQTINTFLTYIKIWGKTLPLTQPVGGYFWTILGIYYLCNTTPAVIKNLTPDVLHQTEPLEGFDVWMDPEDYPCLKIDLADLFIGFISFLNGNQRVIFNTETGDTEKSDEFFWAVTDFFTKRVLGVVVRDSLNLKDFLNEVFESVKGIEKLTKI
jgi:hypothetical protein